MPRGSAAFNKHQQAAEQRQAEYAGTKADYFGLSAGDIAVVRFLEQGEEIAFCNYHRVPMPGRQYPQDIACLDQNEDGTPCPGCQSEHKSIRGRSLKGLFNMIWRGGPEIQALNAQIQAYNAQALQTGQPQYPLYALAPVYKRNEYGAPAKDENTKQKIIQGYADGLFLWKASKTVYQSIVNKDQTIRGLMSRDMTIRRQGAGKDDTVYFIEPLDINTPGAPMSQQDIALAQQKYDLDAIMAPPSYEEFVKLLTGQPGQMTAQGPQPTFDRGAAAVPGVPAAQNAFMGGAPVRGPGFQAPAPVAPAPQQAPPVAPIPPQAAPIPQAAPVAPQAPVQPAPAIPVAPVAPVAPQAPQVPPGAPQLPQQ